MLTVLVPLLAIAAVHAAWWLRRLWRSVPRSNADFGLV